MTKSLRFIIPLILLLGCKKEEKPIIHNVFGITYHTEYQYPYITSDSLFKIDFSTGQMTLICSFDKFSDVKTIYSYGYSKNKNLFIFNNKYKEISVVNLENFTCEHINLLNYTDDFSIHSILVDENENILYLLTYPYYTQAGKEWLGLIPLNLNTKKFLPRVNFRLPDGIEDRAVSAIDYQHKRIFIKPFEVDSLFLIDYNIHSMSVLKFEAAMLDLNYNESNGKLFGTGRSKGNFELFEYSIPDESLSSKGGYTEVSALIIKGFYYDRFSNSYWVEKPLYNDAQMLNIDLSNIAYKQTISIPKQIQFIFGH